MATLYRKSPGKQQSPPFSGEVKSGTRHPLIHFSRKITASAVADFPSPRRTRRLSRLSRRRTTGTAVPAGSAPSGGLPGTRPVARSRPADREELRFLGAVGTVCPHFFDVRGDPSAFDQCVARIDERSFRAVERHAGVRAACASTPRSRRRSWAAGPASSSPVSGSPAVGARAEPAATPFSPVDGAAPTGRWRRGRALPGGGASSPAGQPSARAGRAPARRHSRMMVKVVVVFRMSWALPVRVRPRKVAEPTAGP